jgi:hypothetical protein
MYLTKYTNHPWRDDVCNGRAIRVGSILHYREIESERFRDEREGDGRIVHRAMRPLTAEVHNRIFWGTPFRLTDGWKISTNGVALASEPSQFNAFVFSCTLHRRNAEIGTLAAAFRSNACYFIKNPRIFADTIAAALKTHVESIAPSLSISTEVRNKLHLLEVLPVFGKVKYTDESKDKVVTDDNIDTFDPHRLELKPLFRKEKRFEREQEFRFLWVLNLGRSQLDEWDISSTNTRIVDLRGLRLPLSRKPFAISEILDKAGNRVV